MLESGFLDCVERPNTQLGMTNKYRFVHLSDIHFGQERDGTLVTHDDVRNELLRDCRTQSDPLGQANGILITGDIAYSGRKCEYDRAGEWLDRLTQIIGCPEIAVNVVPGNHDVDLDRIDYIGSMAHKELRAATDYVGVDAVLNGIASGNEAANPLLPKFLAYREFASRYECDFQSATRPLWEKDCKFLGRNVLRFIGMNSVQVSNKQDTRGQMVLGNSQYVIPREDSEERLLEYVVMIHHPLYWLKDHLEAERYLRRARVIMVGHEHDAKIQKMSREDGSEQLEIYAGATNPPGGRYYSYRYNWLEYEITETREGIALVVTVHPRVWDTAGTRFIADTARLDGLSSKSFSLKCTEFESIISDEDHDFGGRSSNCGTGIRMVEDDPHIDMLLIQDESEQFARLRYFFWKYLDWSERLKILVDLDLLPSTLNQPVPQTFERLALDKARTNGKLHELWAAVMTIVPAEKREPNPFQG
jgi:hypothetical protein